MMLCQRKVFYQLSVISALLLVLFGGYGCSGEDPEQLFQKGVDAVESGKPDEAVIWLKKALQLDPEMPLAHYRLGQIYHGKGEGKLAFGQLSKAVELDPAMKEARKELIYLLVENRALDQTVTACTDFLEINGDDEDVYMILGNSLAYQRKLDEAVETLTTAAEKYPENEVILINLARVQVLNGKADKGRSILEDLVEKSPENIEARISLSEIYGLSGRYDLSLLTLEALKSDYPEDPRSYLLLAQLALRKKHSDQAINFLDDAEKNGVMDSGLFRMRAMILHREGKKNAALSYFQKAVDSATDETRSVNMMILADYYIYLKKYPEAQAVLEKVIAEDSTKKGLQSKVVELFMLQGKFDQAKRSVDTLLKEDSGDARGHFLKGLMMMKEKNVAAARKQFSKAQELAPNAAENQFMYGLTFVEESEDISITEISEAVKKNPELLKARMALAELFAKKGDFQASLEELDKIIKKQPDEKKARVLRISVLLKMAKPDEALSDAMYLVEKEPEVIWHSFRLAEIYFFLKEYDKALPLYRKLQEEKPDSVQVLNRIISIHMLKQEPDKALELVDSFLAKYPEETGAVLIKAKIYQSQGYLELAENVLLPEAEKGKEIAPLLMLAGVYQMKKDNEKVALYYEKALSLEPENIGILMKVADFYLENEKYHKAIDYYEKVLEQKGDFLPAMNNLAFLYTEVGENLDRALELAGKTVKALPDNPDVADTLGWIYVMKKSYSQAEPYLSRAIVGRPDNPTILYHMGILRLKQQRLDEARTLLGKAIDKKISGVELIRVNEALKQLQQRQESMEEAVAAYENGDTDRAQKLFEDILATGAFNSTAAATLAVLYAEQDGAAAKAQELAQKAHEADPDSPIVLDALGWVYFQQDSLLLAGQFIEKSIGKNGSFARALLHLAAVHLKKNELEAAEKALERAGSLELSKRDRQQLEKLREMIR